MALLNWLGQQSIALRLGRLPRAANGMATSVVLLCVMSFLVFGGRAAAQGAEYDEYEVKGAFLYKFTKFVACQEPLDTTDPPRETYVIGILGKDPFGHSLDQTVAGRKVGDKPIEVKRASKPEDLDTCDLVFIAKSEESRIRELAAHFAERRILTVGDADDFAKQGGMIHLEKAGARIQIQVNLEVAERAKLKISSELLKVAAIVKTSSAP